ncbi:GMC oxidoreductase [Pseudarthrobacter raffinosi]|uniref:GMC oxidoreductase n=1 Tax=Pseudarthrobacter raffinosi TaxID=2953651 RepID=UPI00208E7DAB|nr:GMC family oxidoreductase [Pseudarthrobacter sp. MDT3-9]MCO4253241.1 GMC family oxidoreductase [Pseudarthrobacter sp. MDT3-9]
MPEISTALRPGSVLEAQGSTIETDILIIGSGMGGGTLSWALRNSGRQVLVVERGDFLPREPENSQPEAMYLDKRYSNAEDWYDGSTGKPFRPGVYYWVGGNTKFYGACLPRFRREDFEETAHHDGSSQAWPFDYDTIEPFYAKAEELFQVHGRLGEDPTEPHHSTEYPSPALEHEPTIERFASKLRQQGLHPFHMSNGMNLNSMEERRADTISDGAPSESGVKSEAENRALRPALQSENVSLLINAKITKLITSPDGGTVVAAEATLGSRKLRINAKQFVVSAGAVNSAVLLLNSANEQHPNGLGNSSGLLGRNYMVHNSTFFMGVNPIRRNPTAWQKTLGLNDWYVAGKSNPYPLGNLQMLGKLQAPMVKAARSWAPLWALKMVTDRSLDIYLTTEDLPDPNNRIRVEDGKIIIDWKPNNIAPHEELVRRISRAVRKAGYPIILTERMGIATNSHMCGTAVAGSDPATSVLNENCRSHDLENLWIIDGSFFPSSAALNPALTIAANALRVAPIIAHS